MESEDILKLSAVMLNMDESVVSEQSTDEKARSLLVTALNNVISEIAEEYVPFIRVEKVSVKDGKIPYTALQSPPMDVIKIKKGIRNLAFCRCVDGIVVNIEDCEVNVTYSYIPEKIEFGDSIGIPSEISVRTLAAGVAGEYALMTERYEECVNYDNKFISGIKASMRTKKERKLPYKRWI